MVLDKLGESIKNSLKRIAGKVIIDKKAIEELVKDIQRALLQADVNVKLVFEISNNIKEKAISQKVSPTKEQIVKIVYDELVSIMGKEKKKIEIKKPFQIMLVGLFGSGKTTAISKLARFYSNRGFKVCSLGLDVHRPAAMDQLEQVSKKVDIKYFIEKNEKNPIKIYEKYKEEILKFDIILIDTSGRDALNDELIQEIESLTQYIKPNERFLVLPADIGQAAQKQAEQFHKSCNITGIIISRMDGSGKAGGALTAATSTNANIVFIGTGENPDDLEEFNPEGFVSRLLGMGDLESLLEKAKLAIDEKDAKDTTKKMLEGRFNLQDLYSQISAMKKMGPLSKIMNMLPGMGSMNLPKEMMDVQDEKLTRWKYIMDSCTKEEKENPEIMSSSRIERISNGSGVPVQEIREMLKTYKQSKKIVKMMKGMSGDEKDMKKMLQKMKGLKGMK